MTLKITNTKLGYFGRYREYALAMLSSYLEGKPDTEGWRDLFNQQQTLFAPELDWTPIPHEGRIVPKWALIDFYVLTEREPELRSKLLKDDKISAPSLDLVLETC